MKIKDIIKVFLSSFLFIIFLFSMTIFLTILNPKYIIKTLDKENIYQEIYLSINEEMNSYVFQSGFDGDIINDLFTVDTIKNDFDNMLKSVYKNTDFKIDTTEIRKNLDKNINEFIKKDNISNYDEEALNNFKEEIINSYKSSIDLKSLINSYSKYIVIAKNILLTIMILSLISFMLIFFKLDTKNSLKYFTIMFLTISFTYLGVYIYLKNSLSINSIYLFSSYISLLITKLLNKFINSFLYIFIVVFIIGIISSIIDSIKGD